MKNIHLQETVETPEEEVKQPAAEEPVETKEAAPEEEKQTEEEPKNNISLFQPPLEHLIPTQRFEP